MAQRTVAEDITALETERDYIETHLTKLSSFKSIEAQGTSGAKSEYTDPAKLQDRLKYLHTRIDAFYSLGRL